MADKPENVRELVDELSPTSILPPEYKPERRGDKDVLSVLFRSRERVDFPGDRVPPWWSPARDQWLWQTMLGSDYAAGAIFSTCARLSSIPLNIRPRDPDNRNQRRQAMWSDLLLKHAWATVAFQIAMDWQTQDNGAFIEILGAGDPAGPIAPTKVPGTNDYVFGMGLRVLDAQKCQRTRDPEYPVIYRHIGSDGVERFYKFHHTRIMYFAQMPTTRRDMLGIGFCGMSRVVHQVLRLDDIGALEDEMLGARPISQLIFSRAISADDMLGAFEKADEKALAELKTDVRRSARTVFISAEGAPEVVRTASVETFDLKRMPEGYSPEVYVNIAMNVIAMGLGYDAREFWPATVRGATRADAEVQHWKSMQKTPGDWARTIVHHMNAKWCSSLAYAEFDQQDDEQDRARADMRKVRAETIAIRLQSGAIDHPIAWQMMLEDGDITESQYQQLMESDEVRRRLENELAKPQAGAGGTGGANNPGAAAGNG